ncbi:MAG: acetoin utilization protein AcuB [Gammaproteobacteria bacterium]|jgi:acetoin utilization protein AcuB
MFYIYTLGGRSFSGSLEKLRRVEKASQTFDLRHTLKEPIDQAANGTLGSSGPSAYKVSAKSIAEYQQSLHRTEERELTKHAYQIMSSNVQSLLSTASIRDALSKFQAYDFQVLPIIDVKKIVQGYLSRKNLYEYLLEKKTSKALWEQTIGDVFITKTSRVFSAAPVTEIRRISAVMVEYSLDALPIVEDNGQLVGIVSRTDILRTAATDPPLSLWC